MAASRYNDGAADHHPYMMTTDMNSTIYDGTSSESSASSPLNSNGFENLYGSNGGYMPYPAYPMQYPMAQEGMAPLGLIPVELDIESLYEDHDRRRKKSSDGKTVSSHVHSRRRAQNRASQRAFRDRKEKHMRDLEQRLGELEGRHSELSRSYESLQSEYTSVKAELDSLRKDGSKNDSSSHHSRNYASKGWEESKGEILDPLLFDVSAFCFDQDDDQGEK